MTLKKIAALLAIAGITTPALATDGYFSHGYGMKAKGMVGVGIALPQDGLAAATNPAGIAMVGDRLDIGIDWFKPNRGAEITGNGIPAPGNLGGSWDGNGQSDFLVPEIGYNKALGSNMAAGVAIFGNGGMNTHYDRSPFANGQFAAMGGQNPGGVNLEQLFVAPTFAIKVSKDHSLGISLIYAYQRFGATGLQAFTAPGFSVDSSAVTNRGYAHSDGWGARVGWTGQITDMITLGATYATKMNMSKFEEYKGLFAQGGKFDIPENYGIGIAIKAMPQMTVAMDVKKINYSKIKAIANTVDCFWTSSCQLGADNGPGFGWRDMTVYKLGVSYALSNDLLLRAGYSKSRQPIPESQTFFNILAPGVIENHLTLGGTWAMSRNGELTVAYMHGFEKKVNGSNSIGAAFGGGNANLKMSQDSLGIAYGMKF